MTNFKKPTDKIFFIRKFIYLNSSFHGSKFIILHPQENCKGDKTKESVQQEVFWEKYLLNASKSVSRQGEVKS